MTVNPFFRALIHLLLLLSFLLLTGFAILEADTSSARVAKPSHEAQVVKLFQTENCTETSRDLRWVTFQSECHLSIKDLTNKNSSCFTLEKGCKAIAFPISSFSFQDAEHLTDLLAALQVSPKAPQSDGSSSTSNHETSNSSDLSPSYIEISNATIIPEGRVKVPVKKLSKKELLNKAEKILKSKKIRVKSAQVEKYLSKYKGSDKEKVGKTVSKIMKEKGYKNTFLSEHHNALVDQPRPEAKFLSDRLESGERWVVPKEPFHENSVLKMKYDMNGNILEMEYTMRAGHMRDEAIGDIRAQNDVSSRMHKILDQEKVNLKNTLKNNGVGDVLDVKTTQKGHRVAYSHGGVGDDIQNLYNQDQVANSKQSSWEKNFKNYVKDQGPNGKDIRVVRRYEYHQFSANGHYPKNEIVDVYESELPMSQSGWESGKYVKNKEFSIPKSHHDIFKLTEGAVKDMFNPFKGFTDVAKALDAMQAAEASTAAANAATAAASVADAAAVEAAAVASSAAASATAAAEASMVEALLALAFG